jgi:tRNA A-37 threonylcarbamoyl transferase component Bud32
MNIEYIIVQAGGRGSRLEKYTRNKPKALLPVENLPMIFHLFRKFPDKRFIIIGDYKKDVLKKYLSSFADVRYIVTEASGSGTCSGVSSALAMLPEKAPFMLIWSDLILPETFSFPEKSGNFVGISETFTCRWSYKNGVFTNESSIENGVAGMFIFEEKSLISDIPQSGELVKWLRDKNISFSTIGLAGTREFGLIKEYEELGVERTRPFNKITEENGRLIKQGIDKQGEMLAIREAHWYKLASDFGVTAVPKIYEFSPIVMEKIDGKNVYEYEFSHTEKIAVLTNIVTALKSLHSKGSVETDYFSMNNAYFTKTIERLSKVRDLIPFADKPIIIINGTECPNVYFHQSKLEKLCETIRPEHFSFIHGDCTFSNIMLRNGKETVLIDPRGYFGFTENYGDESYDWAKLYYSVVGNYDHFNRGEFDLDISENDITLSIKSNGWEDMEKDFFALTGDDPKRIRLIHAIIWLSLTTYAWQDYDSICGAFYNGLNYLREFL